MAAQNGTLKNNGNDVYPKTLEMNVYDGNGNRLDQKLAQMSSDLAPYLSNNLTATSLETDITAGNSYTVPKDGFYTLACWNTDANHTRSATINLNGITLVRSDQAFSMQVCVPLKQGTVLTTRATVSASDGFNYRIVSSFT